MGMQPKLRFKGFTDDWEKRKLESIFKERTERSSEGTMLSVTINDGVVLANSLSRKNVSSSDKSNYKLVRKDDIAYNSMRMWQSASGVSNYEGIVSPAYTVLIPEHDVNSSFFGYYFKRTVMKQVFQKNSQGLTSDTWNLKYPLLKNIVVQIPSIEEQIKISEFLKQVDKLIAVNQRKVDLLKKKKAGYLQKLFPRNGQNKPELRFKGYTDAWEKRRLIDNTKLITKGTTPKDKSGVGNVNFIKVENLSNNQIHPVQKISQEEHDSYLKRSRLQANDILFSIAGTLGRIAIVSPSLLPANTNQALSIIRGYDFDSDFLITSLSGHVVAEYIRKNPTVGAQPNLSLEQVGDLIISSPIEEEQEKIGSFFKLLNHLITVNQRKVDLLKKEKKSLLQKMFV